MKAALTDTAMYQAIFEASLAGFFVIDGAAHIKKANPAAERIFGYGEKELIQKKIEALFSKEHSTILRNLTKNPLSESVQMLALRKDGSKFMVDIRIASTVIEGIAITTVFCKPSDLSVFESDRKLRTLVDNTSGIVYRCKNDRDWTMEYISDGCEPITGYAPQEFLHGKVHFSHIIPTEHQDEVWDTIQVALRKKEPFQLSFRIIDKSGNTKYLNELGRGVYDTNGDLQFLEGFITDITHQKETENALEKEKEILSQYLNAAASIFLIIDRDHTITLINEKGCEVLGYPRHEIIGKNWFKNCIPRKEQKELVQEFDQVVNGEVEPPDVYENWVVAKGNKKKLIRWRNALLKDENGKVAGLISSGIDVTEKIKAEMKFKASEAKNSSILDAIPDLIIILDVKGKILEIKVTDASFLVAPAEDLIGKYVSDVLPKVASRKIMAALKNVNRTQQLECVEIHLPGLNDSADFETRLVPFGNNKILSVSRNISKSKVLARALNLRNRALEAAGNGIIIADALRQDMPIIYSNSAFSKITGYEQSEIVGKNCRFLQNDDRDQEAIIHISKAIQEGEACRVTLRNYRKDGSLFWNELSITPLYDEDKLLTHFIGVQNDVTEVQNAKKQLKVYADKLEAKVAERTKEIEATVQKLVQTNLRLEDQVQVTKLAETRAKQSQAQFTAIARNFPKGLIVVFNTDFELVFVEGEELKRVHLNKADFEGKSIDEIPIFSKEQIANIKEDILKTIQGESLSSEVEFQHHFYSVNSTPLRSDGEEIIWALFVYNNITEQKNVQKELAKALNTAQELNELKSRFISMASHEFRTPLSAILSSAILIGKQNEPGKEERREKHVARIRTHVKHLVVILNDFLSLSKLEEGKVKAKPQHLDLVQFCKIMVDEMEGTKKEGQTIQFIHTEVEIPVFLDPKLLSHILINLLSNALKYSDEDHNIIIELQRVEALISVKIKDTGVGIPEEDQQHLFERFFRADNVTHIQGTGLGLHIVKQYTDLMKGVVNFTSKIGKGSTFTVQLPQNLEEHEKNTSD